LQQGGKNATLRFSLEESVWFHKGQEVSELVSLSLEPNVTIQENEQYISIRGSLEMTGEYRKLDSSSDQELAFVHSQQKYVHQVDEREEGLCEFFHRFPVDITLPKNRVRSLEELNISIDSFDYVLPEKACLKLTADLSINGVYQDDAVTTQDQRENVLTEANEPKEIENENWMDGSLYTDDRDEEEELKEESHEDHLFSFSAEAKKEKNREDEVEHEHTEKVEHVPIQFINTSEKEEEKELELADVRYQQDDEVKHELNDKQETRVETVGEAFEHSNSKEVAEHLTEESSSSSNHELLMEESSINEESVEKVEEESSEEKDKNILLKSKKEKKKGKYKTISLTDFFARKDDSGPAKLKVCIVQQGDTLETIAERYDVTQQQILRLNHLEPTQDVYEGQVLYIPVQLSKSH